MKTFKEYFSESLIMEIPLPPDWDQGMYTDKNSFAKQVKYAMQRAAKLGAGLSRVVFTVEYDGRPTALKIAKNAKGLAQNSREADYGLYNMYPNITTPLIDYDETNEQPRWIHLEKADKLTNQKFKQMTGFDFNSFSHALLNDEARIKGKRTIYHVDPEVKYAIENSDIFYDVTSLIGNFDILASDLTRLANWGVYNGHPVIIDLGFNSQVAKDYYSR